MWCLLVSAVAWCVAAQAQLIPGKSRTNDGDYNSVNTDGSFDFGYKNGDEGAAYHVAHSDGRVVGGRHGARDPASGLVKETVYTAGPRGFRAKGPLIHRKMDLDQRPRGPIGNKDDPYFDPNEDPSYSFKVNTRTYSKNENADSRGDVKGHYSYVDDVGERHDVSYVAGRDTGFHVSSAVPDNPAGIGAPFHHAPLVRGEARARGKSSVQRGLDGSYRFISAGPDQRRTESSDALGNVRGSYSFLDDKGVQRTVHYIAGPGIGYRIVKSNKDPYIPSYFPTVPSAYDPDFTNEVGPSIVPDDVGAEDVFQGADGTAASGHVKPPPFPGGDKERPTNKPSAGAEFGNSDEAFDSDGAFVKPSPGSYSPGSGSQTSSTGSFSRPGSGSHNRPGSQGSHQTGDSNASDEDAAGYGSAGAKPGPTNPTGKPGKRPTPPYRPLRPNSPGKRPTAPGRPNKKPYAPAKPFKPVSGEDGANEVDGGEEQAGPVFGVGFDVHSSQPGTTIIRNIGQDYFGVPPGVSVRAHVQSIDLYPYGSKPSPSEAIEKEKS